MAQGKGRAWAVLRVAVLALVWGSTFLWIELALGAFSPVQVAFLRCALGAATLIVAAVVGRRRLPRGWRIWGHLLVAAFFCNALPFFLFGVGQETVGSGVAGVLSATTPLWSLLIGLFLGSERRPRPARLGGLLLGFAGTVLIFAPWEQTGEAGWGWLALCAAAASYAVGFAYMGRHLVGRGVPTLSLSSAQLTAATGLSALALPAGFAPIRLTAVGLVAIVALGVFATGLTFHLTYRIIADEGATNAATVGYLLPVVSVALGAIVLHEAVGFRAAAGMAVVLAGVALTRLRNQVPVASAVEHRAVKSGCAATGGGEYGGRHVEP
ncbi:DMT family transporter [Amycolatopsis saalfeldensis]|uniref:Permease of the drug/metabolite transporter (DMT) superfamily n=1 Tax=Amycolatopsis saalfeldensis TaxID=394193 RepID=A0A1H8UTC6_9PSEU|nr:DMT family transporter [Amycolatopsis saalfeldensis]SEP06237.1 Permease of the drug/metabolite transporter (DMT) superfamily [Amycolatopsis saalfeldensis]